MTALDTYGEPVKTKRRHPKCACKVPCQARYTCEGLAHVGRRSTPWCSGGSDSDECDECWNARHRPSQPSSHGQTAKPTNGDE